MSYIKNDGYPEGWVKVKVNPARIALVSLQEKLDALADGYNGVYLYKYLEPESQITYYHFSRWTATEKMLDEAFVRLVEEGMYVLD
jgi:hypothetical protein